MSDSNEYPDVLPEEVVAKLRSLAIRFDGDKYWFGPYRYGRAEDAIAYAESQQPEKQSSLADVEVNHAKEPLHTTRESQQRAAAGKLVPDSLSRLGLPHQASGRYATTRSLASLFAIIGWLVVAIGVLVALFGAWEFGLAGFLLGIGMSFLGLVQVMGAQLIAATVDTADNTFKILDALKNSDS